MYSTNNPIHSFSPSGTGGTVTQTLNDWKAARTLVSDAIWCYLDTCTELRAVWTSLEHSLLEEALVTVDSELESLDVEAKALFDARISLATMRNRSTTLARINTLPPEILSDILISSGSSCSLDHDYNLYDLMGVCAYWKAVVLNTTDLWNHIDVGPQTLDRMTDFSLERAKGHPVHLHVYEAEPDVNEATYSERKIYHTIDSLAPYMSQVCTLDIESYTWSRSFVDALLDIWLVRTRSLLRSLTIYLPKTNQVTYPNKLASGNERKNTASNKGVQSLTTLHLQNVMFGWMSGAYHNLTDLRLDFNGAYVDVPISHLADILASSPGLTILKLKKLAFHQKEDLGPFAPVTLGCLEIFHLETPTSSVQLLLSLISLPSTSIKLGLSIRDFHHITHPLQTFFARSKASMLYWLHYDRSLAYWLPISQSIPPLQTLVLDRLDMEHDGRPGPPHNSV
ncbi:hypothetical protein FRC12_021739, partial [Ceratobasidium sp. 428]